MRTGNTQTAYDPHNVYAMVIHKQRPASIVLETRNALAFLPFDSRVPGHCTLIPKGPFGSITDMSQKDASLVFRELPRLCRAVRTVTGAQGVAIESYDGSVAGCVMPHVCLHVVPVYAEPPPSGSSTSREMFLALKEAAGGVEPAIFQLSDELLEMVFLALAARDPLALGRVECVCLRFYEILRAPSAAKFWRLCQVVCYRLEPAATLMAIPESVLSSYVGVCGTVKEMRAAFRDQFSHKWDTTWGDTRLREMFNVVGRSLTKLKDAGFIATQRVARVVSSGRASIGIQCVQTPACDASLVDGVHREAQNACDFDIGIIPSSRADGSGWMRDSFLGSLCVSLHFTKPDLPGFNTGDLVSIFLDMDVHRVLFYCQGCLLHSATFPPCRAMYFAVAFRSTESAAAISHPDFSIRNPFQDEVV